MNQKPTQPPFAILFDMDGVLIDSEPYHSRIFLAMGRQYGYTDEQTNGAFGRGGLLRDFYERLAKIHPVPVDFEAFGDEVVRRLLQLIEAEGVTPDPARDEFLSMLRDHHIPIAVGTSAIRKSAVRKLAAVELHNTFDVVVTAEGVSRHKPFPDVYLEAARQLGVSPSRCIVIDDSPHGIEAGKRAGAHTVGFTRYDPDKGRLSAADLVVDDFAELTYQKLLALAQTSV